MLPAFPVYLFDVDGTLMDSQADICGAVQTVLASHGRTDIPHEVLVRYIGRHLIEEFVDFGFSHEQAEQMMVEYRGIYAERKHAATKVYPGVASALDQLGGRKSTATTKGTPTTRLVLEQFGLIQHFDHVQGTDGFAAKPDPGVLLKSLEALGARPADCLLVGDSPADMEAGRRAGIRTCAVTWGYGEAGELARWEPDFWIDAPHQLLPDF
ncbi:MAG: HAD family hydrolase [Bryobacterales bacterium]|nr:HAD family hydrolase [Bryobacterales bacterium]